MPTAHYLDHAVDFVQRAIDEDTKHNYYEAYKLYQNSLDYFLLALKYEKNEKSKLLIKTKLAEYLARAETLKGYLENTSASQSRWANNKQDGSEKDVDTMKPREGLHGIVSSGNPNVKWDNIAGLKDAKASLQKAVIMPIKFPHLFTGNRVPCKSILLYGPPGTGKTCLAKAIATEAKKTFFSVNSDELFGKRMRHDTDSRLLERLFKLAREEKPAIIFFDDIDSLARTHTESASEVSRKIQAELLVQMDRLGNNDAGVLVLGATNIPWQLDKAMVRGFEKRIYVPLPGLDARRRMFEIHVGSTPCQLKPEDYDALAKQTEGYSAPDISVIVRDALMQPINKVTNATHFRQVEVEDSKTGIRKKKWTPCSPGLQEAKEITWTDIESDELLEPPSTLVDFLRSLENTKPTVTEVDMKKYENWTQEFGNDDA